MICNKTMLRGRMKAAILFSLIHFKTVGLSVYHSCLYFFCKKNCCLNSKIAKIQTNSAFKLNLLIVRFWTQRQSETSAAANGTLSMIFQFLEASYIRNGFINTCNIFL